jgi:hypothetical protein
VKEPSTGPGGDHWRAVLPEVGGYVGGAFVVAAILVLVGPRWDTMSWALQIALFAVPAVVLIAAALAIALGAGEWSPVGEAPAARRRVVAVLLVVGAALGAGAAAVIAAPDSADRAALTTASALLAGGYLFCRSALTHLALLAAGAGMVVSWTAWSARELTSNDNSAVAVGIALAAYACGWLIAAASGLFVERAIGVVGACALAFAAAEILVVGGEPIWAVATGYLVLALIAAGGLVGYVRTRMIGLLVVGVVALATVVPQAVLDFTNGAIGAGGALLLIGLSIIGASVLGFRLRRGR